MKTSVVCLLSSVFCLPKVGCPIRKSADQSFFAAPHGLSQRSTSFIASQRQGIHQMPLSHLIALITRNQLSGIRYQDEGFASRVPHSISLTSADSRCVQATADQHPRSFLI